MTPVAAIGRFMNTGQLGVVACAQLAEEVLQHFGEPEGIMRRSRKDASPAILKYGWVQFFIDRESGTISSIFIYVGDRLVPQRALTVEMQQTLLNLTPATLFEVLADRDMEVSVHGSGGHRAFAPTTEGLRSISGEVDELRVRVTGGGEAIFGRTPNRSEWRLEKMHFSNYAASSRMVGRPA